MGCEDMFGERFYDKFNQPTEEELLTAMGDQAGQAWTALVRFAQDNYDHEAEWICGGKNYGWNLRYRKSGKTLFCLFPEQGSFALLLVLGKKEVAQYQEQQEEFSESFRAVVDSATQYHDGKWIWLGESDDRHVEDIKRLIRIKKKGRKTASVSE